MCPFFSSFFPGKLAWHFQIRVRKNNTCQTGQRDNQTMRQRGWVATQDVSTNTWPGIPPKRNQLSYGSSRSRKRTGSWQCCFDFLHSRERFLRDIRKAPLGIRHFWRKGRNSSEMLSNAHSSLLWNAAKNCWGQMVDYARNFVFQALTGRPYVSETALTAGVRCPRANCRELNGSTARFCNSCGRPLM